MTIIERLDALRKLMRERQIDIYIVPTSDFHQTETVGSHFKAREFMSGFTGSDGTLAVTLDEAALWVDGRYFLQAEKELEGSGIIKMEMGEPGVPNIAEYIDANLCEGGVVGFDGRVVNAHFASVLEDEVIAKMGNLYFEEDLVGMVWEDRPKSPKEKAWLLADEISGQTSRDKIIKLQNYLMDEGCDAQILSTLDDIAWLLNMRGNDIECFPVVLSYMVVTCDAKYLFVDTDKLDENIRRSFEADGIEILEYDDVYDFVLNMEANRVLVDLNTLNYRLFCCISGDIEVFDAPSPTQLWKACKNPVELENSRNAHIKDGVAVTKFLHWLKQSAKNGEIKNHTEATAADKLLDFRKEQDGFIEPSFDTIAAYESNGAYVHYHATENDCSTLDSKGLLLVDSGGHYCDGSTDITRTVALGEVSDKQKFYFTTVLRGMIRLSKAKFLKGCTGMNLDILCRSALWDLELDYKHGTGHGVGYISAIHEGPNGFRWKKPMSGEDAAVLEVGMVTSNEPGFYLEGEFGIRIENEIVVKEGKFNDYGQFMEFETLTFAPIDVDVIDVNLMNKDEILWLDGYHKEVYEKLSPYLEEDEKKWLKGVTKPLQ